MKVPVPIRKKKRTSVMRTNERSRRIPGSQVSRAMDSIERPCRGTPGGPSSTNRKVRTARLNSMSPTMKRARPQASKRAPAAMMAKPATRPTVRMTPTSPLAMPTCCSATRSGTKPWYGPWAKLELNCRPRKSRA